VIGIHYQSYADYTRVVIDLNGEVKYRADRIPNPDRIYFDLTDAELAASLWGKSFEVRDGRLRQIRVAQYQKTTVRIVLGVDGNTEYSIVKSEGPSHLVIDLHGSRKSNRTAAPAVPVPEPARTEPIKAATVKADAAKAEAAQAEPEKMELVGTVLGKAEPIKTEPVKTEPAKMAATAMPPLPASAMPSPPANAVPPVLTTATPPPPAPAKPPAPDPQAKDKDALPSPPATANVSNSGQAPGGQAPDSYEHLVIGVTVNGKTISQFADTLRTKDGRFLVTADVLHDARLASLPSAITSGGQTYYSLDAVPGAHYQFDEDQQTLLLQLLPASFQATVIDSKAQHRYTPTPPPLGMFFNHDIQFLQTSAGQQVNGLIDTGIFNSLGVFTNDFVNQNFLSSTRMQRLDTRFSREMPGRMRMLTIGDTVSASDTWSQSVHYAGVQFASNFAIQPSFVPFALPTLQSQAAQPSTVDIYMNNLLMMKQTVDAGPFTIQNIPVMTPEGNIRMVVTDVTGHQQIISGNYLSVSDLLRKGVTSYSYEGGIMRWGEGTLSDNYHIPFVAATQRWGITNAMTVSMRSELLGPNQTFGGGAEFGIAHLGVVAANFAASHSDAGLGTLVYALVQHRTLGWQVGGSVQVANPTFRQLGLLPGQLSPRLQAQAQVGRSFGRVASFGAGYLLHECQGTVSCTAQYKHLAATTVSFGIRLWNWGSLTNSLTYSPAVQNGVALGITLSIPLQHQRHLMVSNTLSSTDKSALVDFQQSVPNSNGYGYRARFNTDSTDVAGELDYRNRLGLYSFAAERSGTITDLSAEEKGGIVFLGGAVMPTRWVDSSFALVDVPGQPGIRVYANNQYISKTDSQGRVIVPLVPFDGNAVRLDDKDVPVQFAMDLDERKVVPYSRTGMLVRFKAEETKGATLILRGADGKFLALGSQVTVPGLEGVYEVAYDGEVYIENLVTPAEIHVHGKDFECDVAVPKAPAGVDLPRIGPLTCEPK
jgi:outer membrane usher protein